MDLGRVEEPLRNLRKMLKKLPQNPPPDEVHRLRTSTRRIEAVASALKPTAKKETRRLLKVLKPLRKAAGRVRDMDVLTADLLHLNQSSNNNSILRLTEYLAAQRNRNAGKLLDTVSDQLKPARRRLKNFGQTIESVAVGKKPVRSEIVHTLDSTDGGGSAADALIAKLNRCPALNARNLHDFRLKVKELRYVLQMLPDSDARFVDALGAVKDQIGEWHDWQQLAQIAHEVLNPEEDLELFTKIENEGKQKLIRALTASNSLRRRFLNSGSQRRSKVS